jgi:hypothetical protein
MTPHSPAAETLMRHLGLVKRTTAEIQDLYSLPADGRSGRGRQLAGYKPSSK